MAAGLLSGKYDKGKPPVEGARYSLGHWGYLYNKPYWNDPNFAAIEQLKKIADGAGVTHAALRARLGAREPRDHRDRRTARPRSRSWRRTSRRRTSSSPRDVLEACDAVWLTLRPPTTVFYGR